MTRLRIGWQAGVLCLLVAAAAMAGGARSQPRLPAPRHLPQPHAPAPDERVEVPPPPFTDGIFPVLVLHASMPVNRTRRELTEFHTDIVLKHDEQHRWCLDATMPRGSERSDDLGSSSSPIIHRCWT